MSKQLLFGSVEIWGAIFCIICFAWTLSAHKRSSHKRALRSLAAMLALNSLLLLADSMAWIFRGVTTGAGAYLVRYANTAVFIISYLLQMTFLDYVLARVSPKRPRLLRGVVYALGWSAIVMLLLNHKMLFLFGYDQHNFYYRKPLYWLSEVSGILISLINFLTLVFDRKQLPRNKFLIMSGYIVVPTAAVVVQTFVYGFSLSNVAATTMMIIAFANELLDQMRDAARAREQVLEQQSQLQTMKLQLMTSQLQPHFVINVLNTIYFLIKIDSDAAQQTVEEFSKYLRNNIRVLAEDKAILFTQEYEYVSHYLNLEKVRYDDDLQIETDIRYTGFAIAPFALQTLVENAVSHGIKNPRGTVSVKISSCLENGEAVVAVEDNGAGFDMTNPVGKEHVGLRNTRYRLEKMCGGRLEISSEPGKGTSAVIRIPVEKA